MVNCDYMLPQPKNCVENWHLQKKVAEIALPLPKLSPHEVPIWDISLLDGLHVQSACPQNLDTQIFRFFLCLFSGAEECSDRSHFFRTSHFDIILYKQRFLCILYMVLNKYTKKHKVMALILIRSTFMLLCLWYDCWLFSSVSYNYSINSTYVVTYFQRFH